MLQAGGSAIDWVMRASGHEHFRGSLEIPILGEREQTAGVLRAEAARRSDSWATQTNKLTAMRMVPAWATRTKPLTVNPAADLELPRLPKRLPRAVIAVSETEQVLAQLDCTTAVEFRDRAILELLYSTGIRRTELVGLDCIDLDAERVRSWFARGKARKTGSYRSASGRCSGRIIVSIASART